MNSFYENGLYLDILVTGEGDVRLLNLSDMKRLGPEDSSWFRMVELQESGCNQDDNCGSKHTGTQPGRLLRYLSNKRRENGLGAKLSLLQRGTGLEVTSFFQFFNGVKAVKSWTELFNREG